MSESPNNPLWNFGREKKFPRQILGRNPKIRDRDRDDSFQVSDEHFGEPFRSKMRKIFQLSRKIPAKIIIRRKIWRDSQRFSSETPRRFPGVGFWAKSVLGESLTLGGDDGSHFSLGCARFPEFFVKHQFGCLEMCVYRGLLTADKIWKLTHSLTNPNWRD